MEKQLLNNTTSPLVPAIEALRLFREQRRDVLSSKNVETLREVETRLIRLDKQYKELLEINTQLMESDPRRIRTHFDPESDTITVGFKDQEIKIRLNRADPNVPLGVTESSGGAYIASKETGDPDHIVALKSRMESGLEGFYYSAHRIQKLMKTLPGIPKTESRAITIVRNKLVEHPDAGDFYSFGWSSNGPVVRPTHRPGRQWADLGLVPNMQEFANVVIKAFS